MTFEDIDGPPPWWRLHSEEVAAAAVFVLTVILTVTSFPPFSAPEFAYAFAAPAIFWAYLRPSFKLFSGTMFAAQAVAWIVILSWLRHVTWVGLFILGPIVGAWIGTWYLAVWWAMPRILGKTTPVRLSAQIGLAGLWVVIEWTRTWFLGGFPWLPLAASQWQVPSVLQLAAFTGAGGVSFVLIMTNIGFAAYAHRLFREGRDDPSRTDENLSILGRGMNGFSRRSQEFMLALFLLLACLCVFLVEVEPFQRRAFQQPFARVAFIQPDIPAVVKWDPASGPGIVEVLQDEALRAAATLPDLVLWPESVTPWAIKGDPTMRAFVESLAKRVRAPMIMGSNAIEGGGTAGERWYNAAFSVDPEAGVQPAYYAKRKLVPFGEYVPLRPLFGWISKFVPIGDDFTRGTDSSPLLVNLPAGAEAIGVLICYEDVFPSLARDSVASGADALAVLTNDAWYGEEGAAAQHASHSVLRAVEMRRPVLRCGNGGWSGWIDEFGYVRANLTNDAGSVYFRGTRTVTVTRDSRWAGHLSFYAQHGEWFLLASVVFVLFGHALLRAAPKAKT